MLGISAVALIAGFSFAVPEACQEVVAPPARKAIVKGAQAKELDAALQRAVAFGFSGAVYVSKKGKPILLQGYGIADPISGAPCTPETLFDIASASKQITAAAILKLEEKRKLSREDLISEYLPGVPKSCDDITIDHLLTHTSGMPRSATGGRGDDLKEAVSAYLSARRPFRAGEQFAYWNGGYALLAGIVEEVSGRSFEDYVREALFEPAKLQHTDFIETARVDPSLLARTMEPGHQLTTDYIQGWGYRGMGGVLTSAADLGLWVEEVFHGGRVVSKKMRKLLVRPELQGYARGWRTGNSPTGQNFIGHGGDAPGFHTDIRYFPDEEYILILITNVDGLAYPMTGALESILFENRAFSAPPELLAWEESEQAAWLGTWQCSSGERLKLEAAGESLAVTQITPQASAVIQGNAGVDLGAEVAKATEIVLALAEGDHRPMQDVLAAHVPASWPRMMVRTILPPHLQVRGKILSASCMGAKKDGDELVTVWLDVQHEKGSWPVEMQFRGGRLSILDWETESEPKPFRFAQVAAGKCVHFAFSFARTLPELSLLAAEDPSQARLLLKHGEHELAFQRAPGQSAQSEQGPKKPEGTLRVMQFNIWQEGTSVEGGFDKIVDVILASKADVVALSEVRNYNEADLHERLVQALAERGETFYGQYGGGDVGVLSRWPVIKTEVVADSTQLDRGSIIAFHLRGAQGQELVLCSAHLDYRNYAVYLPRGYDGNSFKLIDNDGDGKPDPVIDAKKLHAMDEASARDDALRAFVDYVQEQQLKKRAVILAGDFNECSHLDWTEATRDLYSHNGVVIDWKNSKMLHEAGFRDSWRELYPNPVTHPGATWPAPAWKRDSTSWAPLVDERDRIDFIYHNGQGLQAHQAWIVGSAKYYVFNELAEPKTSDPFALTKMPWPSDHKGLLVDFVWGSPQTNRD